MKTEFFSQAAVFLSYAENDLARDEVKYGLMLGIAQKLVQSLHAYGEADPWFCVLRDETKLLAAAIRTPPYKILLAHFSSSPSASAELLADSISGFSKTVPGAVGESEITDSFIRHWCDSHKVKIEGRMAQNVYKLEHLSDIKFVPGNLRLATEQDKDLVVRWGHAFHEDVYRDSNISQPEDDIIKRIHNKELYLWEDGLPVSMAAKARPTENGMRINAVYTPPELRGRGYATSCVGTLCREVLDSGSRFCTLYADAANPVSNSIYRKIGFQEICDSVEYSLGE
jgi:uncharacterized protein